MPQPRRQRLGLPERLDAAAGAGQPERQAVGRGGQQEAAAGGHAQGLGDRGRDAGVELCGRVGWLIAVGGGWLDGNGRAAAVTSSAATRCRQNPTKNPPATLPAAADSSSHGASLYDSSAAALSTPLESGSSSASRTATAASAAAAAAPAPPPPRCVAPPPEAPSRSASAAATARACASLDGSRGRDGDSSASRRSRVAYCRGLKASRQPRPARSSLKGASSPGRT
jgi:hypothetical protein